MGKGLAFMYFKMTNKFMCVGGIVMTLHNMGHNMWLWEDITTVGYHLTPVR